MPKILKSYQNILIIFHTILRMCPKIFENVKYFENFAIVLHIFLNFSKKFNLSNCTKEI
jgi:hypothetical protein